MSDYVGWAIRLLLRIVQVALLILGLTAILGSVLAGHSLGAFLVVCILAFGMFLGVGVAEVPIRYLKGTL